MYCCGLVLAAVWGGQVVTRPKDIVLDPGDARSKEDDGAEKGTADHAGPEATAGRLALFLDDGSHQSGKRSPSAPPFGAPSGGVCPPARG